MHTEEFRTYTTKNFTVQIDIVDFCQGSNWLQDLYTATDTHQAGITIQVPSYLQGRNCPKFYIGQTTPDELARDYAKQGRTNPSKEAYACLQKELAHYIQASDCALRCTVTHNGTGIELAETYSICFDYSCECDDSIEGHAKQIIKDYGIDFIKEAIQHARDTQARLAA
jgi:hypothetical protein